MFRRMGIGPSKISSKKNMMIIGIVGIFLVLSIYIFVKFALPLLNKQGKANKEYNNASGNKGFGNVAEILFFKADWCPHCKKAAPEWGELQNIIKPGSTINGYTIKYTVVDCTDDKAPGIQEKLSKFKVEGFPTIKLLKDNEVIEFDAKPEAKTLENFLNSTLNN